MSQQNTAPERNLSPAELVLTLNSISKQHSLDLSFTVTSDKKSVSAEMTDAQYANLGRTMVESNVTIQQLLGNKLSLQYLKPDPAKPAAKPKSGALGGLSRVAGAVAGAKAGSAVEGAAIGGAVAGSVGNSGGNTTAAPSAEKHVITGAAPFSTADVVAFTERADLLKMALEGHASEVRQSLAASKPASGAIVQATPSAAGQTAVERIRAERDNAKLTMATLDVEIQNIDKQYADTAFTDINNLVNTKKMPPEILATENGRHQAVFFVTEALKNLGTRLPPENFGSPAGNGLSGQRLRATSESLSRAYELIDKGTTPETIESFKKELGVSIRLYENVLKEQLVKAAFDKPHDQWVQRGASRIGGPEAASALEMDTPANRDAFGKAMLNGIDSIIQDALDTPVVVRPRTTPAVQ